ncbi:MAG: iron-containing redox enzyme family protein [Vulcanimicrobiota bacterium]
MNWVQQFADRLLLQHSLTSHPYFQALTSGSMSRDSFIDSQREFLHAVRYFSRAMGALLARQPTSTGRQALMHNLAEEHGWDEDKGGQFQPGLAHDQTFLRFLDTLRAQPAPPGPEVLAFNLALYGACATEPVPFAFASLGMIEYAFADISALIGRSVIERGWVDREKLVHYSLHAEIDKRHAAEFFEVVVDEPRLQVESGLEFGWHIFSRFYRSLGERQ